MYLAIAIVLAGTLLAMLFLLIGRLASWRRVRSLERIAGSTPKKAALSASPFSETGSRECPLCFSDLAPGERVASKLFPGKSDRIMRIFGCVHCWPATPSVPRICPVCGQALDAQGWVTARYFERPGRKHVHVLGCTNCRDK
jgi:hypothetical protein